MSDKIKKLFKGLFSDMAPAKLFVLLMSFSTAIYFTIYLIIGNGFYTDMFFGNSRDFFMDFFNSIRDASNVDTVYTEAGVIYPPMANLIFLILSRFLPGVYNSTDFDDRYDWVKYSAPFMLVVITAMIFAIALHWIVRSNLDESNKRRAALFSIFAVFNVPVLYMIERGNILMFCFLSLLIYAFTYNSESKGTREIGLIALAFAFSLKLYPVIFGWILIRDKRFKDAIRCAIYGIAMIVLPAFAFGGFKVFGQVLDNIMRFSSSDDKSNIFSHVLGFFNLEHINVDFMTPVMWLWAATVCLCFVISPFVTKDTWRTYAVGALAIICIPSLTSLYAWSFTLAPIIMICNKKELSRKTWFYCVFMMIPFIMIPLRFHYAISNNGFVLNFCAAILSIVAVADTIKDLVLTIKANRSEGITLKQYFKSLVTVDKAS